MKSMRAAVFQGKGKIAIREVARPQPSFGEVLLKTTVTTICETDVHILKGEYPVRDGLIVGHEPVGVIEEIGPGVIGYQRGDRVIVGAITPCGQCQRACRATVRNAATAVRGTRPSAAGGLATHPRLPSRICPRPQRAGKPRPRIPAGCRRRRAPLSRHHVDRVLRGRERRGTVGRRSGHLRRRPDRPLRDGRRTLGRRVPRHRRRLGAKAARVRQEDGGRRRAQFQRAGRGRRNQAADRWGRRRRHRGAR